MIKIRDDWKIVVNPPYEVKVWDNKGVLHYHYLNIKPVDTLDLQIIVHKLTIGHRIER